MNLIIRNGTANACWAILFAAWADPGSTVVFAQESGKAVTTAVIPAAATSTSVAPTDHPHGPVVRFRLRPTQRGDRVDQKLGVQLGLTTKIVQSGQIAHESTNEMRRQQERTIEVLEAVEGRATKVLAAFPHSRRMSPENSQGDELMMQPIEGKSYLMTRHENEMSITDLEGALPPIEEFKLVAESLENVGKPNPLAALLVDRRIAVGERIRVPRDMVQPLLGLEDPIGSVRRFELTLVRVEPPTGERPVQVAAFHTDIEVAPNDASPLAINLAGEIVLETETCRLLSVDMTGPVQMSSIERTGGGIFQFNAGGELQIAIRAHYDQQFTK